MADWAVPSDSLTLPPNAGPGQARMVLGPDIPPELVAFFTGTVVACQLTYFGLNSTDYSYTAWVVAVGGVRLDTYEGWVIGGSVKVHTLTSYRTDTGFYFKEFADLPIFVDGTSDLQFNGVSTPRGVMYYQGFSTNAAIGTGNADFIITPSITFRTGRAYRVKVGGRYSTSLATNVFNLAVWWVPSGADIAVIGAFGPQNGAVPMTLNGEVIVCRNSPTGSGVLTIHGNTNTGTASWIGAANAPRSLEISDIGSAGDYPGAASF